jgi:two-component system, LytTR family, response regulator
MNPINCLIVDDEVMAHQVLKSHLAKLERAKLVGNCYTGTEAYNFLLHNPVDVVFLDINMPELNGLDLIRSLPNPPAVVLTTAYSEFALESYDLNVVDYLLKPIGFPRFLLAFNKVLARLSNPAPVPDVPTHRTVKADGMPHHIALADLLYVEGLGNYVKLHLPGRMLVVLETMQHWEDTLPTQQFCRIHKSFLVNLARIDRVEAEVLWLKTGQSLPLGRKYAALLADRLRRITAVSP